MRRLARVLDLLYPTRCLICDLDFAAGESPWWCRTCEAAIPPVTPPVCDRCAQSLETGAGSTTRCSNCEGRDLEFVWATAIGRYQGRLRQAVHRFKFLGMDLLARPFAAGMARALHAKTDGLPWELVVPIPPSRASRIFFPRNPAELLAIELSLILGIRAEPRLLRKVKPTPAQSGLRRDERLSSIIGSMQLSMKYNLTAKTILIVDDIMTTGATCSEAARVLRHAGAGACHVVAIAR